MENFIKHKSLVEQIVQGLEEKILEGALQPGERIIEGTLCKALGVSRSPVREAFRILESKGFVTSEPRKGISIAKVEPQEAEDIYLIRANLESLATYLAVKKQNPSVLEKLKKLNQQMIEIAAKKNVRAYFNLNLKFHQILVEACENRRLIELINNFSKQTMRYRFETLSLPDWMNFSITHHNALIQSFESGDAKRAESIRKEMILSRVEYFIQKTEKGEKN
ncbi:MAG: GntR family transcriptional regulator [Thermodesulfobacteriota bacterium]|nr:GntR family transcriptional regulator [Thermodesulfobacteriota bacterium]